MKKYTELKDVLEATAKDFDSFYESGNKAAGTRVRKAMLEIKKIAQDIRTEVSDIKKQEG